MKKIIPVIVLIILMISACAPTVAQKTQPIVIKDAVGREVSFDGLPQRIIVAGKQTPMLVNFLYLFKTVGQKIAAIENRSQTADVFLSKIDPNTSSKYILEKGAGVEQIAPLNPDVVILKTSMRESVGKSLEEVGIPVVYIEFETVNQIYRDLRIFADLLGEHDRGEQLIANYQDIKSTIDEEIKQSAASPVVALVQAEDQDGEWAFTVPSDSWLQTDMIEELGANAVWKDAAQGGGWTTVNVEQLLNWNPGYLFVINYQGNGPSVVSNLKQDAIWQNLNALKSNNVYAFAYDFQSWDQPDPRWILGYAWLANRLYPQQVSIEQVINITQSFYEDFYGLSVNEFNQFVEPKISPNFQ